MFCVITYLLLIKYMIKYEMKYRLDLDLMLRLILMTRLILHRPFICSCSCTQLRKDIVVNYPNYTTD
jgi:hypothetical protein